MKQQCVQSVAQALGKSTLNQQEIKNIEQRIRDAMKNKAREDIQTWRGLSDAEKLKAAAEQVAKDISFEKERKLQIAKQDILTQTRNIAALDHAYLPASEVIDRMIANHGDMSGIQSIDSKARATASIYRSDLVDFYTNVKGALGILTDRILVQDIVKERFGETSSNPLAKKISDQMGDTFENMRNRFNRNGGDIGKLDDWGIPQSHNALKMGQAGKTQWVNDAIRLINRDKYVHEDGTLYGEDQIKNLLEYSFDSIFSNGANKIEVGKVSAQGSAKATNRHSESRVLHFKGADAWLEYQNKYGGMQFVDLIEAHIASLSKDIVQVESLGSNPRTALKILMDAARSKEAAKGIGSDQYDRTLSRAQTMYDEFTGANAAESQTIANIGLGYRAMNVASMLGGTTLSSITDQAMIAKTAHVHGLSYWKAFGNLISDLNPRNKADREQARSLAIATEEMLGSINRWSDDGLTAVHGKSEKFARISNTIASQVLRISGLNALTAASKTGFSKLLMDKYGRMSRDKNWTDLSDVDRALLEGTGLNERAWQVMRLADPIADRQGNQLMSARSIYEIPDHTLLATMDDDVKLLVDDITNQVDDLNSRNTQDDQRLFNKEQRIEEAKRDLSDRLQAYANRQDAKAQAEKQALQDRIDLIDAQKEAAAAQSDINTYIRNLSTREDLKNFIDGITQGKNVDNLVAKAEKLGREKQVLDNKVANQAKKVSEKIKGMDKEVQAKFDEFTDLLGGKTKLDDEALIRYEDQLAQRLNRYAVRRDVIAAKEVDALNDLKQLVESQKSVLSKDFEIQKAVEQSRTKQNTDQKIDRTIERSTRRDYQGGEDIGRRLGNAERRIVEARAKIRKADSEANKAINQKFNELDKRVQKLDDEFSQYQTNVADRQLRRQQVMDRLNDSIDDRKKELAKNIREEVATRLQTHYLDEQGMAVVEAGLRERTMLQIGKRGTVTGEIWRGFTQFKSFPMALLMRHGSRGFSSDGVKGKAAYIMPMVAMTSLLGALVVQLKELANGNDPVTMWDENDSSKQVDFFKRSVAQGGGLSFLGDILVAGSDASGRDMNSFLTGMIGGDTKTIMGLTIGNFQQAADGKETNWENEAFRLAKSKTPGQNLWYTKAAMNRLLFDELQDTIAPGYREKALKRAERRFDRSRFWGDDIGDIRSPDFERVIQ